MTSRFDEAHERRRGAAKERAAGGPDDDPVVRHQMEAFVPRLRRQVALAGAGRALDQRAAPVSGQPQGDEAGVQDHVVARAAGMVTTNLAPVISPVALVRFSAWMAPPCASMIWRAIERPRPELPPNAA